MEIKLTNPETELLKRLLNTLVIKERTGEAGILHGADRFVSTHICLKKEEIETLEQLARKTGLANVMKR